MRKRKTPSPWDGWDYLLSIMGDAVTLDIRWPITDYNQTSITLNTPAGAMTFAKDKWPGGASAVLIDVEEVDEFITHVSSYFAVIPEPLIRQLQSARDLIRVEDAKREARFGQAGQMPPFDAPRGQNSKKSSAKPNPAARFVLSDRPTALKASLVAAYLETEYRVYMSDRTPSGPTFTMQVGEACPSLAQLMRDRGVQCAAFLTACHPYSAAQDGLDNSMRQKALLDTLNQHQVAYLIGASRHPSEDDGPGQPGVLALNLPIDAAKRLGVRFEQNAALWCSVDAVPNLVLLM